MAYQYTNKKRQQYFLHKREVILRGSGKMQTIYFFSKTVGNGAMNALPDGYLIVENTRTGLPVLKRK